MLKTNNFNIAFILPSFLLLFSFFFLPLLADVGPLVLLEILPKPCDQIFLKVPKSSVLCSPFFLSSVTEVWSFRMV